MPRKTVSLITTVTSIIPSDIERSCRGRGLFYIVISANLPHASEMCGAESSRLKGEAFWKQIGSDLCSGYSFIGFISEIYHLTNTP